MAIAAIPAENPFMRTNAKANASDASGNSGSQPSSISSNDFLTLLVTEMKNQDPTAQTDPNQYVNQLVQVNSLEQLIEINQNLSTAIPDSGSGAKGSPSPHSVIAPGVRGAAATIPAASSPGTRASREKQASIHPTSISTISGNLSAPGENPAAHRIAQALSGRS